MCPQLHLFSSSLAMARQPLGSHHPGTCTAPHSGHLLADDLRGGWYPSAELLPLWHCLRLLLISKLWAAYSTARLPPTAPSTAAQIAALVMADARAMIRRDWLLVDTDVRQHTDVLSDWLRGRHPCLSRAAFVSRWCRGGAYAGLLLGIQLSLTFCGQPTIPFPYRTGPP
jgi:hypothetical protein